MKELEEKIVKFAEDRDWLQFNTPENLAKSISIEAGELLECFQWNNNYDKDELKFEIADVMNYCILLCHQIGVDPKQIILDKMKISETKYPVEKAKGVQNNEGCLLHNHSLEFECTDAHETYLFYDEWSGRYFESTIENLMNAEYRINRNFVLRGYAFLRELYDFLGLDETDFGNTAGWAVCDDEVYWLDFYHRKVSLDDNLECYIVECMYEPSVNFLDW